MKTSSAKNKGRRFQQEIAKAILDMFPDLEPDDVLSKSMGAGGEDIMLSPKARKLLPISIEAKNVEKLSVWAAYKQAQANAKTYIPVLFMRRNRTDPLVVLDMNSFLWLLSQVHEKGS